MDEKYKTFFLNCRLDVVGVETVEISHPSFSQVYYLCRNSVKGFTAADEDSVVKTYQYVPMSIDSSEVKDNMDASIDITLGDVGTIIANELSNIRIDNSYDTEGEVIYRLYRSDDTTAPILVSKLKLTNVVLNRSGSKLTARAPKFNVNKTGERYTIARFPMLRGCL